MCSLCITSITNINVRMSAGEGTSVHSVCMCSIVIYVEECVSCVVYMHVFFV